MKKRRWPYLTLVAGLVLFVAVLSPASIVFAQDDDDDDKERGDHKVVVGGLRAGTVVEAYIDGQPFIAGDRPAGTRGPRVVSSAGENVELFIPLNRTSSIYAWYPATGYTLLATLTPATPWPDTAIHLNFSSQTQYAQGGFPNQGLASPLLPSPFLSPGATFQSPAGPAQALPQVIELTAPGAPPQVFPNQQSSLGAGRTPGLASPAAASQFTGVYIVQPGESLGQIAQQYGVSVTGLARVNGITNANLLTPGQYLAVPALGSYSNF